MASDLLVYCLLLYFPFHILNRASFATRLKGRIARVMPSGVAYATGCAFCWTWWIGVMITVGKLLSTGVLTISPLSLMAAPVLNLLLDLAIRALIKANEPPLLTVQSVTTNGAANTVVGTATSNLSPGQLVCIPSMWTHDAKPAQWTTSTWMSPGIPAWAEKLPDPLHVGRRVEVVKGGWSCVGKRGTVRTHYVSADDCSCHYGKACYSLALDDGSGEGPVYPSDCILLDDTPSDTASTAPSA